MNVENAPVVVVGDDVVGVVVGIEFMGVGDEWVLEDGEGNRHNGGGLQDERGAVTHIGDVVVVGFVVVAVFVFVVVGFVFVVVVVVVVVVRFGVEVLFAATTAAVGNFAAVDVVVVVELSSTTFVVSTLETLGVKRGDEKGGRQSSRGARMCFADVMLQFTHARVYAAAGRTSQQ